MERTRYSPGPLWTSIRDELRRARVSRAARLSLEHELASYTSPSDLNDLEAILARHTEDETADIRRILAGRHHG